MFKIKKIYTNIIFLFLLFLATPLIYAYCTPFFAVITDIENRKDCLSIEATNGCGGEVFIKNNCQEAFYLYLNGDINYILINHDEWMQNYEEYEKKGKIEGISYVGHTYINSSIGLECTDEGYYIQGINACDWNEVEKIQNGTILKNWSFKIRSIEDKEDIIVNGYTEYRARFTFDRLTISLLIPFIILLILVFIIKHKVIKTLVIILLVLLGCLLAPALIISILSKIFPEFAMILGSG